MWKILLVMWITQNEARSAPSGPSRTQAWKEVVVGGKSMYSGTLIEDLIGVVAKAEDTIEVKRKIEEEARWIPAYSAPSFEQIYRESLLAGVA